MPKATHLQEEELGFEPRPLASWACVPLLRQKELPFIYSVPVILPSTNALSFLEHSEQPTRKWGYGGGQTGKGQRENSHAGLGLQGWL